jgi:hypothetical protein
MAQIIFAESAAPATPSTGKVTLYAKTDGLLYSKDDAGAESAVGSLRSADIGVTVQAYDMDTAKLDVVNTWAAAQTFNAGLMITDEVRETPTVAIVFPIIIRTTSMN